MGYAGKRRSHSQIEPQAFDLNCDLSPSFEAIGTHSYFALRLTVRFEARDPGGGFGAQ